MGGLWRDKAASLMCVGLAAPFLDDRTRILLDAGVSGVLLYQSRLDRPESVATLVHAIKAYAGRPVYVAVDHEGAQRSPLQGGFTRFPVASRLGATGDIELARSVGQVLGRELRAVGVDMTLGPVLDVATNPNNPIIGERSLGDTPEIVSKMGAALVEGQQSEGVAACGKHFPGHGDTHQDSNLSLPILPHGVRRLEEVELKPFQAGISSRMAGMLVGHILFKELDSKFPSSLSRPIIFGLLRQKLRYRGFLMIDDVDMGALSRRFTRKEIAVRGMASGADSFLCARRPESALELMDAIDDGVERGTVLPERIEAARRRLTSLIHRYVQDPGSAPDLSTVGQVAHVEILQQCGGGRPSLNPKPS